MREVICDGSVGHCTYRNVVRDSKYTQNMREILNCSRSLADDALHPSSNVMYLCSWWKLFTGTLTSKHYLWQTYGSQRTMRRYTNSHQSIECHANLFSYTSMCIYVCLQLFSYLLAIGRCPESEH